MMIIIVVVVLKPRVKKTSSDAQCNHTPPVIDVNDQTLCLISCQCPFQVAPTICIQDMLFGGVEYPLASPGHLFWLFSIQLLCAPPHWHRMRNKNVLDLG